MKKEIYLDNAATTACLPESVELLGKVLTEDYGNPSSVHMMGVRAEEHIEKARGIIADGIKCKEKELFFTSGGTESNNLAIFGAVETGRRRGKHIITSAIEHSSVLNPIKQLEKQGYEVSYISCDKNGMIRLDEFASAISKDTILVSIMHVNNETGVIQPIYEIGNMIQQKTDSCLYHVDAVQSIGKIPISLSKNHIDLLSGSGHKFHAPKGCGFLYKRESARIEPLVLGGGQEKGLRSGTENVAGIAAMAHSFAKTQSGNDEIGELLSSLKAGFIEDLLTLDDVFINGYCDETKSAHHIVNVRFKDVKSEVMVHALEDKGIYASAGSACSSHSKIKNRTLLAMGLSPEEADCCVRFSFSMYTDKEQLKETVKVLGELLPKLRKFKRK